MQIHQIDLHYHAGQERQPESSLHDYLMHARITGRRVLGLTDHLQFFLSGHEISAERASRFPYEPSLDGLARYRGELDELRGTFDDLELYFAPEVPPKVTLAEMPQRVLDLSDYFICECFFPQSRQEHTEKVIARLEEMAAFTAATGKPTFLAHPFRNAVNYRLVKREIEPWVTAIEPRSDRAFDVARLSDFFLLDVDAVGAASARTGVPLEVNGGTQGRVRASNLPAALQMLWASYERFLAQGATLVPGSDQHAFTKGIGRMGGYVPFDCFEAIGVKGEDIDFLNAVRAAGTEPTAGIGADGA